MQFGNELRVAVEALQSVVVAAEAQEGGGGGAGGGGGVQVAEGSTPLSTADPAKVSPQPAHSVSSSLADAGARGGGGEQGMDALAEAISLRLGRQIDDLVQRRMQQGLQH